MEVVCVWQVLASQASRYQATAQARVQISFIDSFIGLGDRAGSLAVCASLPACGGLLVTHSPAFS